MNCVRLIDGIVEWCQSYEWPDWRITETLIGVLEFDPKDIEKAGYGYLIEEYFAEEQTRQDCNIHKGFNGKSKRRSEQSG